MKIIELEALRGFAAFYVFLHHTFIKYTNPDPYVAKLFIFGQEAVMLFFLLSGFVIVMSQTKHNYTFKTYFMHRFLRIYSVVLPAILLSYIVFGIVYSNWNPDWQQLIMNLLMFQDKPELKPGVWASPAFHNEPLWSLSYEWWFYMMFFLQYKLIGDLKNRLNLYLFSSMAIAILGIFTYKIHYNQISLFMIYYFIWASGGVLYMSLVDKKDTDKRIVFKLVMSYLVILGTYIVLFIYHNTTSHYVDHPILEARHYIAGLIYISMFFVVVKYKSYFSNCYILNRLVNLFARFAPISFAFYVVHYPIMLLFDEMNINGYVKITIMFTISVIISIILEIKLFKSLKKAIKL